MELPTISSSQKSLTILDLLVFTALLAMVLAGIRPPASRIAGAQALLFLGSGTLLWQLAGVSTKREWLDLFVAVIYLILVVANIVLCAIMVFVAPLALVMVASAQLLGVFYVLFRTQ